MYELHPCYLPPDNKYARFIPMPILKLFGEGGWSAQRIDLDPNARNGIRSLNSIGVKDLREESRVLFQDLKEAVGDLCAATKVINADRVGKENPQKLWDIGHFLGSLGDTMALIQDLFAQINPDSLRELTHAATNFLDDTQWFIKGQYSDLWMNLFSPLECAVEKIPNPSPELSLAMNNLAELENAINTTQVVDNDHLRNIGNFLGSLGDSLAYVAESARDLKPILIRNLTTNATNFLRRINQASNSAEHSPLLNLLINTRDALNNIFAEGVPGHLKLASSSESIPVKV